MPQGPLNQSLRHVDVLSDRSLLAPKFNFHQSQITSPGSSHSGMYLYLPGHVLCASCLSSAWMLCHADVPLMFKVGFQHSLSTFSVHLHHLLGARDDDDVRILEDEL